MSHRETKSSDHVSTIDWGSVSVSSSLVTGGVRWEWSGSGTHTITVNHSDGTSQTIAGFGRVTVTLYDGMVYDFDGA